MPVSMQLREAFRTAVRRAMTSQMRPGLVGISDNAGGYTLTVPGLSGWTYVRVIQKEGSTNTRALNPYGLTLAGNDPVWLDYNVEGQLCIISKRSQGLS